MLFLSFTTVLFSFSEYRATRFTRFSESTMRKQAAAWREVSVTTYSECVSCNLFGAGIPDI